MERQCALSPSADLAALSTEAGSDSALGRVNASKGNPVEGSEKRDKDKGSEDDGDGEKNEVDDDDAPAGAPGEKTSEAPRQRASTGPTLMPTSEPFFGAAPALIRRMSTIGSIGGSGMGNGGLGGGSLPAASIDMSDLNNLVSE